MQDAAFLLVRANVPNPADRPGFDAWYHNHHLGLALKHLRAEHAWRFWSVSEPAHHVALYRFPTLAFAEERMRSEDLATLLADFDAAWPHISRTREILQQMQVKDA